MITRYVAHNNTNRFKVLTEEEALADYGAQIAMLNAVVDENGRESLIAGVGHFYRMRGRTYYTFYHFAK